MSNLKEVTIANGDLRARVLVQTLSTWQRNGWTVVDDGDSEKSGQEPAVPVEKPKATEPKAVVVQNDGGDQ